MTIPGQESPAKSLARLRRVLVAVLVALLVPTVVVAGLLYAKAEHIILGAELFLTHLALLMVRNPPAAGDGPMLLKLARIGVAPGPPPQWSLLDGWTVRRARQAQWRGR